MNVVIVESPAKAKTINKYLGSDYKVLASFGHVRDLPSKDGSVKPDEDFAMTWEVDSASKKRLKEIEDAVKSADQLILATDPDREGEAISWHVLEILRKGKALEDKPVQRVVFNEITKRAILDAMEHPRELNKELIEAYLARRALDYLVGFTLSPVLWRKLPGARSAGRVQSVALRLICDRELEIEAFEPREYWSVDAGLKTAEGEDFSARLVEQDGKKLGKFDLPDEASAMAAKAAIEAGDFTISEVESKPAKRHPAAPFTTSTLQQEASRKLGFNAGRTMRTAQSLYEGVSLDGETVGLITYMRTDGVQIAQEAIFAARDLIGSDFGENYMPEKPRFYSSKAKNAQEAHEAIRPTDVARKPDHLKTTLTDDQFRLYELIWKRTISSQMESATFERTTANITTGDGSVVLRANGSVLTFPGFLAMYREGVDEDSEDDDKDRRLPPLKEGSSVDVTSIKPEQHFTEPPPRYTEASLVKKLEELGIGRPSTYASVLEVLRERNYVHMDRNRFIPEDKGRLVTAFLESFFTRYVEYDFTANLEEQLDEISAGDMDWKKVLRDFWQDFSAAVEGTSELRIAQVLDALNEVLGPHIFPDKDDGTDPRACPSCDDGRLSLKVGRFGAFIGCTNYPDCKFTRPLSSDPVQETGAETGVKTLGEMDGQEVTLRSGRFGPYVQLGEPDKEKKEKPKRASIPKDLAPDDVDLQKAKDLLSLPREVGTHPETGKTIKAAIGRYGPYVNHDGQYANLPNSDEVFTVGVNRAVDLLAEKAKRGGRGSSSVIKELGEHPDDGGPIQVMKGRYGPYVKHKRTNATIPKDQDPENIDMDQALALLAAKAKKPAKKRASKKKS